MSEDLNRDYDCHCFKFGGEEDVLFMDDICIVSICSHCGSPVVVYIPHNEKPTGRELVHMEKCLVEYGSKKRRLGIVDKGMQEAPEHFHLHLR